jgi:hypothetical protein
LPLSPFDIPSRAPPGKKKQLVKTIKRKRGQKERDHIIFTGKAKSMNPETIHQLQPWLLLHQLPAPSAQVPANQKYEQEGDQKMKSYTKKKHN